MSNIYLYLTEELYGYQEKMTASSGLYKNNKIEILQKAIITHTNKHTHTYIHTYIYIHILQPWSYYSKTVVILLFLADWFFFIIISWQYCKYNAQYSNNNGRFIVLILLINTPWLNYYYICYYNKTMFRKHFWTCNLITKMKIMVRPIHNVACNQQMTC